MAVVCDRPVGIVSIIRYRDRDRVGTKFPSQTDRTISAAFGISAILGALYVIVITWRKRAVLGRDGASYGVHEVLEVSVAADDETSGLASVELLLNGEHVETPLTLDLAGLAAGEHELVAVAHDEAGHSVERSAVFTVVYSFQTVGALVDRYHAEELVTATQRQQLLTHLRSAETAIERGQLSQADAALRRFATVALSVSDQRARSTLLAAAEALRRQL